MTELTDPRQVILVTSREEMDILGKKEIKDNIITLAWHMPTSFDPLLYAISVGKTRFTSEIIKRSRVFVVNFVSEKLADKAMLIGTKSGRHIDKFKESGLTKEEADSIDCCRIREAAAYAECEVVNEIETGDHTLFIGKVLSSKVKTDGKRLLQKNKSFIGA
ncbi:MAG TPA: flavin reductase family protein [Candidatus Nanoarchaeia archaeon]|nr:flavin reductase family protein [Candidatus Nanoarchaeia archaeon]